MSLTWQGVTKRIEKGFWQPCYRYVLYLAWLVVPVLPLFACLRRKAPATLPAVPDEPTGGSARRAPKFTALGRCCWWVSSNRVMIPLHARHHFELLCRHRDLWHTTNQMMEACPLTFWIKGMPPGPSVTRWIFSSLELSGFMAPCLYFPFLSFCCLCSRMWQLSRSPWRSHFCLLPRLVAGWGLGLGWLGCCCAGDRPYCFWAGLASTAPWWHALGLVRRPFRPLGWLLFRPGIASSFTILCRACPRIRAWAHLC